jgi:hypothetical protein
MLCRGVTCINRTFGLECLENVRKTGVERASLVGLGSRLGGGGLSGMARSTRRAPDPPPKPSPAPAAGQRDLLRAGIIPNLHPPLWG